MQRAKTDAGETNQNEGKLTYWLRVRCAFTRVVNSCLQGEAALHGAGKVGVFPLELSLPRQADSIPMGIKEERPTGRKCLTTEAV